LTDREAHETDKTFHYHKLFFNADFWILMIVHVKIIIGIVVSLKKLSKAEEFSKTVHTALCAVNANFHNSFWHNPFPLVLNKTHNSVLVSHVRRNSLAEAEILDVGQHFAANRL
jgi:hypothetical protein